MYFISIFVDIDFFFHFRNFNYDDVHNVTARKIAKYSKEAGVKKLLHFSSLNASPNPPECFKKGGSDFLKSKVRYKVLIYDQYVSPLSTFYS